MSDYEIHEEASDHKFHTQIPNLLIDLVELGFLKQSDAWIYTVIKRIAGDEGKCTYSMENLAKKCGFSENFVRKSIKKLETHLEILNCPLILVYEQTTDKGGTAPNRIKIMDIWRKNGDFYREKFQIKKEFKDSTPRKGGGCTPRKGGTPPCEPNEDLIKEDLKHKKVDRSNDFFEDREKLKKALEERKFKNLLTRVTEHLSEKEILNIINHRTFAQVNETAEKIRKRRKADPILEEKNYFYNSVRGKDNW